MRLVRLFLYGSLLDPALLARRGGEPCLPARLRPATLAGWRRVSTLDGRYPTLRRARSGRVRGAVLHVPARALARLAAWEWPSYHLARVVVATPSGNTVAHTWIAPGAMRRPWKE